ncbi:MerR family transcriptional regulator [Tropicimonas sp.]|uniref:MerR family transcriptional regulator n=1 Tax=Tropicimonas sp. TaxID=2067044 RepID=UPI003A839BCE
MNEKAPNAFRTISEVADWLGVNTHVLRFWESKFSQVKPVKRAGGRRYYRPADMELLGGIRKLLHDDGMTIKGVQKILREQGVRAVAALSAPVNGGEAGEATETESPVEAAETPVPVRSGSAAFAFVAGAAPEPDAPQRQAPVTARTTKEETPPGEPAVPAAPAPVARAAHDSRAPAPAMPLFSHRTEAAEIPAPDAEEMPAEPSRPTPPSGPPPSHPTQAANATELERALARLSALRARMDR